MNISQQQQNSQNMYRVGDYVYFENSASSPFAIRRIDELKSTFMRTFTKLSNTFDGAILCLVSKSKAPM